ncbi:hypothetical protein ANCCAN_25612 [Ancylostoma caninum]|uniref:Calponin-homology (CH) domain-containing protein n=2 Tax=Ancylostoma caninum TaxID=29170 RepID=A0A368F909_ANCCA|nr:hypothetical protein ANCCAN_25612 [Ancylostoma caninum]
MSGNRYEDCCTVLNSINDTKTAPQELVESQQKAVMSVWWSLVQAFWKRFGPDPIREEKLTEAIKQWCLEVTKDYEAVSVCDFTSSWRDGYAFNCLLHSFEVTRSFYVQLVGGLRDKHWSLKVIDEKMKRRLQKSLEREKN